MSASVYTSYGVASGSFVLVAAVLACSNRDVVMCYKEAESGSLPHWLSITGFLFLFLGVLEFGVVLSFHLVFPERHINMAFTSGSMVTAHIGRLIMIVGAAVPSTTACFIPPMKPIFYDHMTCAGVIVFALGAIIFVIGGEIAANRALDEFPQPHHDPPNETPEEEEVIELQTL